MGRFLFVDGNHAASRARHSQIASLRTAKGEPSGILCGILKSIHWACKVTRISMADTLVCWDGGRAKKRLELYPEYKLRPAPTSPEEMQATEEYFDQLNRARVGLSLLGAKQVRVDGVEADDLISIFARDCEARGDDAVIYSGDKDFDQCASDNIRIVRAHNDQEITTAEICRKWGVASPSDITELRAIVGDSSDNISGVPGIGEKRVTLIFPFRDLIFTDDPAPAGLEKWIALARQHRDIIERNYRLMFLPRSWSESFYNERQVASAMSQAIDQPPRRLADFMGFCRRWEFTSILEQIGAW